MREEEEEEEEKKKEAVALLSVRPFWTGHMSTATIRGSWGFLDQRMHPCHIFFYRKTLRAERPTISSFADPRSRHQTVKVHVLMYGVQNLADSTVVY